MVRKKKVSTLYRSMDIFYKQREQRVLLLEQDYELASLFQALETKNESEVQKSKLRLTEIHTQLERLKVNN